MTDEPLPIGEAVAAFLARVLDELVAQVGDEESVRRTLAALGVEGDPVETVVDFLTGAATTADLATLADDVPAMVADLARAEPPLAAVLTKALRSFAAASRLATTSPSITVPELPDAGRIVETMLAVAVERTVQARTPMLWATLKTLHLVGPEVTVTTVVDELMQHPTGFVWRRLQHLRRHLDITITGILTGPRMVSVVTVPVAPTDTTSQGLRDAVPTADVLLQRVTLRLAADAYDDPVALVVEVAGHDPGNGDAPSFAAVALSTTDGLVDPFPLGSVATLDLAPLTEPLGVAVTGWGDVVPIVDGQRPSLRLQTKLAAGFLLGDADGLHLRLGKPVLDPRIAPDGWGLRAGLEELELRIPGNVAGDVVALLLPRDGLRVKGKLVVVADDTGLHAEGGVELRTTWPDTLRLPGLLVRALTTEITTGPGTLAFAAAGTVTVDLGVLTATIEGLGLTLPGRLTTDGSGNLGLLDLGTPEATKPTGLGLSLDAGVVKGGGFLRIEPTGVSGALELALTLGTVEIAIRAVGVLEKVDGRLSFVVVMSVEFSPAIELFLGLTLNAVGGVLGINRTLDAAALTATVRSGRMEDVMFPRDLAARAVEVIASVKQVFPARLDQVVAGPMLKLGWGRPVSFVTVSVGVVFTFPDPVVIAIIGTARISLPAPDVPLIDLRADFAGVIDVTSGEVSFDASLTGSRIATFDVSGDLALRAGPSGFLFTAGGFYPGFPVPTGLGEVRRLSISIAPSPVLGIRADAYFALTGSTVQFGGGLAVVADLGPIGARGNLNLDVLIRTSPTLRFTANLTGRFRLTFSGEDILTATLDVLLEGPGRWHARARAEIEFLFFSVSGTLELSWGSDDQVAPPAVRVAHEVREALDQPPVWAHVLPAGDSGSLVLREGVDALHPLGRLRLTQTVAPLGVTLARFGSASVLDAGPVRLDVTASGIAAPVAVEELFAAAQFFDLSDEEKISKPAFVPHHAGYVVQGDAWRVTGALTRDVVYEESNGEERPEAGLRVVGTLREDFLDWSVVGAAGRARGERVQVTGPLEDLGVGPTTYHVAESVSGLVTATGGLEAAFAASTRLDADHVVLADYELAGLGGLHG